MTTSARERFNHLAHWTHSQLLTDVEIPSWITQLQPVGGDAGFRKYFRIQTPEGSLLAVDAPPETEDSKAFVQIAALLSETGIHVPEIKAVDYDQGFLLVEDLGDTLLLGQLNDETVDGFYRQAFSVLEQLQSSKADELPAYSESLLATELNIYPEWFLGELLGIEFGDQEQEQLTALFQTLVQNACQQPQVMVHRDFHSRNLMLLPEGELGVIDFQGALQGPVLYDVVSLLKDCYITWPREKVLAWLQLFVEQHPVLCQEDFSTCVRWFDLMGLQRHLKCLGIFARLWFRDGKPGYLKDIPTTFNYVLDVCQRYDEFQPYADWLKERVAPVLAENIRATQAGVNA